MRSLRILLHHLRMPLTWSGLVAMGQMQETSMSAASIDSISASTVPLATGSQGSSAFSAASRVNSSPCTFAKGCRVMEASIEAAAAYRRAFTSSITLSGST